MSDVILERPTPQIALVTLNRPERLNAMTVDMIDELLAVLDEACGDEQARAIVITGGGRGFCAGHDLADFGGEGTVAEGMKVQEAFAGLTMAVCAQPLPVIAAVNGPAAGGGLALALAADTRVCATSARFNAAFVRLGISIRGRTIRGPNALPVVFER